MEHLVLVGTADALLALDLEHEGSLTEIDAKKTTQIEYCAEEKACLPNAATATLKLA